MAKITYKGERLKITLEIPDKLPDELIEPTKLTLGKFGHCLRGALLSGDVEAPQGLVSLLDLFATTWRNRLKKEG